MIEKSSGIKIEKFSPTLGAIITGVDLSQQITDEQFEDIFQAFADYQVLFFREQNEIPPELHIKFGKMLSIIKINAKTPSDIYAPIHKISPINRFQNELNIVKI